jgi:hypothetical protein
MNVDYTRGEIEMFELPPNFDKHNTLPVINIILYCISLLSNLTTILYHTSYNHYQIHST